MMKQLRIVFAVLFFAALQAAAEPYAASLYPCGIEAGTTVRVVVAGQRLNGLTGIWVSGRGVRASRVFNFPYVPYYDSRAKWLRQWLINMEQGKTEKPPFPEDHDIWKPHPFADNLDQRDALEKSLIARAVFERPNPLQQNPALSQTAIIDITADADAEPGERELRIICRNGISAPKLFYVDKCPHVQEPLYTRPEAKKPPIPQIDALPAVADGTIMPGETDRFKVKLRGGTDYTFSLTGWKLLPYIGDAVPGHFQPVMTLTAADGREIAYADDEYFLPDPVMRFKCPADGIYTLNIRDNLYRGRRDFVYRVKLEAGTAPFVPAGKGSFADCDEIDERDYQNRVLYIGRPLVISGALFLPGQRDVYRFKGRAGMMFSAVLAARRDGSPVDGVLKLTDAGGKVLALVDDTVQPVKCGIIPQQTDPELSVKLPADGVYAIEVSELNDEGGADYFYRLKLGETEPDFNVYTLSSMISIFPGRWEVVRLAVERRNGFAGAIRIVAAPEYLPRAVTIAPDAENYRLGLRNPAKPNAPPYCLDLYAEAEINGRWVRKKVIPTDVFNQAFAYDHMVPARSFCVCTRTDAPPQPKPAPKPAQPATEKKAPATAAPAPAAKAPAAPAAK